MPQLQSDREGGFCQLRQSIGRLWRLRNGQLHCPQQQESCRAGKPLVFSEKKFSRHYTYVLTISRYIVRAIWPFFSALFGEDHLWNTDGGGDFLWEQWSLLRYHKDTGCAGEMWAESVEKRDDMRAGELNEREASLWRRDFRKVVVVSMVEETWRWYWIWFFFF